MGAASNLNPQGATLSLLEPPVEPTPLSRFLIFVGAVALAVVTFVGVVARAIASRWRGILLAHIFFLTLWLAVQVFLFAKNAYGYLTEHIPTWFSRVEVGSSSTSSSPPTPSSKPSSFKPATTICWRDRALDGDCFARAEPHRKVKPHRLRIPEPPPCRRFYMCDDI
jgi:hypothetical protein